MELLVALAVVVAVELLLLELAVLETLRLPLQVKEMQVGMLHKLLIMVAAAVEVLGLLAVMLQGLLEVMEVLG
jgi:hypothetical protein